jgi:hypothetical protein
MSEDNAGCGTCGRVWACRCPATVLSFEAQSILAALQPYIDFEECPPLLNGRMVAALARRARGECYCQPTGDGFFVCPHHAPAPSAGETVEERAMSIIKRAAARLEELDPSIAEARERQENEALELIFKDGSKRGGNWAACVAGRALLHRPASAAAPKEPT